MTFPFMPTLTKHEIKLNSSPLNVDGLLKNRLSPGDQKSVDARRPKSCQVRRTEMHAATTRDEGNHADGRLSAAWGDLTFFL